jgi:hypothetical protein
MNEVLKAGGMYVLTSVLTVIATRYHLSGDQTAAISADVLTALSAVSGVALHYVAYKTDPNKTK